MGPGTAGRVRVRVLFIFCDGVRVRVRVQQEIPDGVRVRVRVTGVCTRVQIRVQSFYFYYLINEGQYIEHLI